MLAVLYMAACLPGLLPGAWAQQNDTAVTNPSELPPSSVVPAPERLVKAIEVKGNVSISTNVVLSKMKTRVGAPYQEVVASEDLKRLYLLGYFSDIKIDTREEAGGIVVVIAVVERPIIEKITFTGIRKLTTRQEKIREQLKSKETQYLDYPKLAEDVRILKKMYEKIGYGQAQIEYKAEVAKETNKAAVQFIITEGKQLKLRRITIDGNQVFNDARLLKVMKTKRAWLFNAGILKEDVIAEDMDRLAAFYRRQGYADVKVSYDVTTDADPKRPFMYMTVRVEEGKKYIVGTVKVAGYQEIPEKVIISQLQECTTGKVFSQDGMKGDIARIQGVYFDRGYISAEVAETTSLNDATGRIDISYAITENQVAYVNKVKVRGNVKTRDIVVRREMRLKPGDRFDGEKLRRGKERLTNLGYFEEISYDTEDTAEPQKKDLIVDVKEAKTGSFSFGGGYSSVDKLIGFVQLEQKNFDWKNFPYFTGAGQDMKVRASFGSLSSGYDISFTEPWMFDYPVSFGFDLYKRTHERDTDVGYGYDEDITGFDLRLGKELSEYLRGDIKYRFDSIDITNISEDASEDLKREYGQNDISSMELALTYDSRDNVFDTTRGNILSGSMEFAGGPFGGDKEFTKFFGRASHYMPLWRGSTLEFRGRMGLSDPFGNSEWVPIYERFFAGGSNTVRGYRERKVGPVDPITGDPLGGEALLVGNLEYTYPVASFLKLAAFYDVGNVWAKQSDFASGNYKAGIGLGVRIKTPIGPLMLDYGFPMDTEPGSEDRGDGRLHFSMSHGF